MLLLENKKRRESNVFKEAEVNEYLQQTDNYFGELSENRSVWGVIENTHYFVLNITEKGIVIIPVDSMGKLGMGFVFYPKDSIKNITFKKRLLNYKLTIEMEEEVVGFKVNKVMVGAKWHKNNLPRVIAVIEDNYNE